MPPKRKYFSAASVPCASRLLKPARMYRHTLASSSARNITSTFSAPTINSIPTAPSSSTATYSPACAVNAARPDNISVPTVNPSNTSFTHRVNASLTSIHPATVPSGSRMLDAVTVMAERKISELPVIDRQGRPAGLLDITDVVALFPEARSALSPDGPRLAELTAAPVSRKSRRPSAAARGGRSRKVA